VYQRLRGAQGVTANITFERSRDRRNLPTHLTALNVLYVLAAMGYAKIDARHQSKELFFNLRP
jgi:hypothetical protein